MRTDIVNKMPPTSGKVGSKNGRTTPMTAVSRLRQDFMRLKKDPVPYIVAEPLPSNLLEWHYVVTGPDDSPYDGGLYHGKLVFPVEFPFNGRRIFLPMLLKSSTFFEIFCTAILEALRDVRWDAKPVKTRQELRLESLLDVFLRLSSLSCLA